MLIVTIQCFLIGIFYLYGPFPGLDVLLSLLDAKLHVADVLAEFKIFVAVKCSVLQNEKHVRYKFAIFATDTKYFNLKLFLF